MSSNEQPNVEMFIENLKESLENDDADSVMYLFALYNDTIEDCAWDIVPIVSNYLTISNSMKKKKLFKSCEYILNKIAETCNPCETILQFLEQIEFLDDDTKFLTLLKPVGICFNKATDKSKIIEWCVSTIQSYMQDLPMPVYNLESKRNKRNNNIIPDKIINIYSHVVSFIHSIVGELNPKKITHQDIAFNNYVTALLISLLGRPLSYLREDLIEENKVELLRNDILMLIFKLNGDPLYFLKFMKRRLVNYIEKLFKNDLEKLSFNRLEKLEVLESEDTVPTFAYANFYFYVITQEIFWVKLPQVYHPYYIFQACIFLAGHLVDKHFIDLINKGFTFIEVLLRRLEKMSIGPNTLELEIYTNLLEKIVKVMVYCESHNERKRASLIFEKYILNAFNMEARYSVIIHLYHRSHHSGVLGLVTGLVKTSIVQSLITMPRCTYFFGNNLESLLKHACNLAHGSRTDLIEISDEIIAGLNLLRFLLIRDQSNETGIWDLIHTLENNFLKPLKQGIHLSKAHWRTKIKDLEEAKSNKSHSSCETKAADVILTVGNQNLPAMPIKQKLEISHQILCGLDVMESLLIRVDECIVNKI